MGLFWTTVLLFVGCGADLSESGANAESVANGTDAAAEIRSVMEQQADAWNAGDIPGFMEGYARTDTLRFASGGNIWRGWEPTLRRYVASYPDTDLMGMLSFNDLEIWPMDQNRAVVFGRWELSRSERYEDIGGLFTLVFQRGPEGWRIVHDHTSSRAMVESESPDTADAR